MMQQRKPSISRFRSWWQQIKQHRIAIGVAGVVLVVIIALIIAGYSNDWTGFNGYIQVMTAHTISGPSAGTVVRTEVPQPGKALWDWMQLLIIPVVLAVGAFLFNLAISRNEQKIAKQRNLTELEIASDNQRESLLQAYLDRMSDLLLNNHLRESDPSNEVRYIARARTLTVLPRLDASRKESLLQFLYESDLISADVGSSFIELSGADLSYTNLYGTYLSGANLSTTDLHNVNLSSAILSGANLSRTNMNRANLRKADLFGADLSEVDLSEADLSETDLSEANLSGTNLSYANLKKANLSEANLSKANLSEAFLAGADLNRANLSGVKITQEQLDTVSSLQGATMPDGSIHA